jgi:hypothetical protein
MRSPSDCRLRFVEARTRSPQGRRLGNRGCSRQRVRGAKTRSASSSGARLVDACCRARCAPGPVCPKVEFGLGGVVRSSPPSPVGGWAAPPHDTGAL